MESIKAIAVKETSNFGGIEIVAIDNTKNKICYCYRYGKKISRRTWSRIRYNAHGEPYFIAYGLRECLQDYMRV